jgi:RNA polymerase sigma-70 factor, ECF subfamily
MIVIVLPDIPEEDRLLAAARRGDQRAIMDIYNSYFPPIYQFIRLRVTESTVAEDLASEVFLKFVDAVRGRNAPRASLRGWLFRVARNVLHDHYGKTIRFPTTTLEEWVPAEMDADPEIEYIRALNVERSRHALRMLSPDQQEVLILRFGQALSLQETADIMGKSVSAVKSLQFRAVETLRHIIGEQRTESKYG